jgi:hypothetical protein
MMISYRPRPAIRSLFEADAWVEAPVGLGTYALAAPWR